MLVNNFRKFFLRPDRRGGGHYSTAAAVEQSRGGNRFARTKGWSRLSQASLRSGQHVAYRFGVPLSAAWRRDTASI